MLLSRPGARVRAPALVLAGLCALPAAAPAAVSTFGSNLDQRADLAHSEQRDIAYWQTAFSDGRPTTVPEAGQIAKLEVRGFARTTVPPGDPEKPGSPVFFLQALTPDSGTVRARISSSPLYLPGSDAGNPDTVTSYAPENFCVKPGEFLSFTGVGGWDGVMDGTGPFPDGTPMQVFAPRRSGANVRYFTADNGVKNGALFTPRPGNASDRLGDERDTELLVRFTLATGDDRSYECGGPNTYRDAAVRQNGGPGGSGPRAPISTAARFPTRPTGTVDRRGRAYVAVICPKLKACNGTLTLRNGRTLLGRGVYSIAAGRTASVRFKLGRNGLRLVRKRRYRATATATAVTQPGGATNTKTARFRLRKRGA